MSSVAPVNGRFLEELLVGAYSHAVAYEHWPELGFRDRAAVELLGILHRLGPMAGHWRPQRPRVIRSRWMDQRCEQALARHPEALCLNLWAGGNTRFHRLSQTADWPRFSWADVDAPPLADAKRRCLPRVDNYRCLALGPDAWPEMLTQAGWRSGTPLLVIAEGAAAELTLGQWSQLQFCLDELAGAGERVELIFDYLGPSALSRFGWGGRAGCAELYPRVHFRQRWAGALALVPDAYELLADVDLYHQAGITRPWLGSRWGGAHLLLNGG